jgi:hypothetical protein
LIASLQKPSCFRFASHAGESQRFAANPVTTLREATNYLGVWIWDKETHDKQTCRFWRRFNIPKGTEVAHAQLRIAVDNAYYLFLDGHELGRGSDWKTVDVYDLTQVLPSGPHVPPGDSIDMADLLRSQATCKVGIPP